MFKKLLLTFLILFSSLITIYPSKKENTNLIDYCYSLEKILSRNSFEKSKNSSEKYKTFAKDITSFGTNKTKGLLVNKIIEQYKTSENTFQSIIYEKSKEKINHYKNIKNEIDEFIKDINFEFNSLKK